MEYRKLKVTAKGKVIGFYEESATGVEYEKQVDPDKHFFIKYAGYGIQKSVFDQLLRGKEGTVKIIEIKGSTLLSKIKDWEEHAKEVNYGTHGPQLVLPKKRMAEDLRTLFQ